jgi:hypothetical protein
MPSRAFRDVAVGLLLGAALLSLSSDRSAAKDKPPSSSVTKKKIAEYFGADAGTKAEILALLDTVPPLKKKDAARWLDVIKKAMTKQVYSEAKELNGAEIRKFTRGGDFHVAVGDAKMKYHFRIGGKKGRGGVPLYINLHGGGNDKATNDSAWQGAKEKYGVSGSLIVPRSTQDVALSWAVPEIWPLMDRLLAECFLLRGVDPDKVYVLGYSMGGWGTLLMGPAMADRWAAVGSSAGGEHVVRANVENLRNTPIIIQIGTEDHAFKRYELSKAYAEKLEELHAADPDGYEYEYKEHEGAGHSISDSDSPKWMSRFTRNPYPEKVVWKPVDVTQGHVRTFYYVAVDAPARGTHVVVSRSGNTFTIEKADGAKRLSILLNDDLADLEKPIVVLKGGEQVFSGPVERRLTTLLRTFEQRADHRLTFSARVELDL